jgi:hypothetical protein
MARIRGRVHDLRFLCLLLFQSERLTEDNKGNEAGIVLVQREMDFSSSRLSY